MTDNETIIVNTLRGMLIGAKLKFDAALDFEVKEFYCGQVSVLNDTIRCENLEQVLQIVNSVGELPAR